MIVYFLTSNNHKKNEVEKLFKTAGINFMPIKNRLDVDLNQKLKKQPFFVIKEETKILLDGEEKKLFNFLDMDLVTHSSSLVILNSDPETIDKKSYTNSVEGFIDLSRRIAGNSVYEWDDIFVELKSMKTYQESKELGNKFSARTKNISEFIEDINVLTNRVDLNFNPLNQMGVVSFDGKINNLINNNKYLLNHKNNKLLKGLVNHVKNEGLFTKSSRTKPQRNYWLPGLNAGIPLVPKKDEIHEITFMFHDLMHHVIPDLIMSGGDDEVHKQAYIIHRMMGEAITIVLADMLFVDTLVEAGIDYDWDKRKIYPVYKKFKEGGVSAERIKSLIEANIRFALLGDDRALIELSSKEVVAEYKSKYEKFFIEDYKWTIKNYENMNSVRNEINDWSENLKEFINPNRLLKNYANLINYSDNYETKVLTIFKKVWTIFEEKANKDSILSDKEIVSNSFINYMTGQLFCFSKFKGKDYSDVFLSLIKSGLKSKNPLNNDDIERIRNFFNLYLLKLVEDNIISKEDYLNFKEIVPLFDPFFVFYDSKEKTESLMDVVSKLEFKI